MGKTPKKVNELNNFRYFINKMGQIKQKYKRTYTHTHTHKQTKTEKELKENKELKLEIEVKREYIGGKIATMYILDGIIHVVLWKYTLSKLTKYKISK